VTHTGPVAPDTGASLPRVPFNCWSSHLPSTIHLSIAPDLAQCLALLPAPSITPHDEIVILPSSLSRRDEAAAELRRWLRSAGIRSHLLVPESFLAAALGRRGSSWTRVDTGVGDLPVSIPTRLARAQEAWTMTDIDETGGRGPYVLDLPARHANVMTRVLALGSPQRAALAVSLLRVVPLANHLVVRRFPSCTLLATTQDPIAAELFSLSLVDETLADDTQVIGPWEDDLVQRAAELELGARLPSDIQLTVRGTRPPSLEVMIGRIAGRMGMEAGAITYLPQE
jgi:hypothetical protein